jgi:hypothetical protein
MRKAGIAAAILLALAVGLPMCTSVPMTAPSNADITLNANPTFVPANGGVSVVTAIVIEPAGTPVANGTVIFFVTNLGRVDAEAKTKDGFARVNFVSDSRSGTARVTAFSGGAAAPAPSASPSPTPTRWFFDRLGRGMPVVYADKNTGFVDITVGSLLADRVILVASPNRIAGGARTALITANVFDGSGNPVANVAVFFSLSVPSPTTSTTTLSAIIEETLDSGGTPQYTDTNGQAFDTLRTRSVVGAPQRTVQVFATTSNGISAQPVTVAIN